MAKWSKIKPGERVELKGREYEVVKIKAKGSSAKVTVRGAGSTFEAKVPLDGKVKRAPLVGKNGAMTRWATEREARSSSGRGLPPGNPSVQRPPAKPSGDPWETRRDKVERRLDDILGARLVGESNDESAGYYVPPVDVSTVAAHLALFHGTDVSQYGIDDLLELHTNEHAQAAFAKNPVPLKVNHWHTETRP